MRVFALALGILAVRIASSSHISLQDELPLNRSPREYIKEEKLGKGAHGTVYRARDAITGELVALKNIQKWQLINNQDERGQVGQEISIQRSLDHPNIVRLIDAFETPVHISLVTELCEKGDLARKLLNLGRFPEDDAKRYLYQIGLAIQYLQAKSIVHRDIKLDNVWLTHDDVPKLGDFGLARRVIEGDSLTERVGTLEYMAPEIVKREPYSFPVDMWAFGVMAYCMLYGHYPFYGDGAEEVYSKILRKEYQYDQNVVVSRAAQNLIAWLFNMDPNSRATIDQALAHRWFDSVRETVD